MSKRSWVGDHAPALITATVLVFMVACATGIILSEYAKVHQVYAAYQKNAEDDRKQAAAEAAETCMGRDDLRLCIAEKLEAHYRDQATNQDLQAQQDMAFWAAALFVSSTVLTTAGLLLIWRTLLHTRDAAIHAGRAVDEAKNATKAAQDAIVVTQDLGEAQVRAYLSAKTVQVAYDAPNSSLIFGCSVSNHGQSPASDAFALVKISLFINDGIVEFKIFHEIGDLFLGDNHATPLVYVDRKISSDEFHSSDACHVQIRVIAKDVFKKSIETSGFFMAGGGPQMGTGYEIRAGLDVHRSIGQGLDEIEFAELIPEWRKDKAGG